MARISRVDTLQKIELAEGVEVSLCVAGPLVRVYALLLDTIFASLLLFFLFITAILLLTLTGGSVGVPVGIWMILSFLIFWFYHVPFEIGKRGASWGKRILRLKVVQVSGAPITLRQSMVRNLLRVADGLPVMGGVPLSFSYGLGLLIAFFNKRFQRLGDLVAGTVVIYADSQQQNRRLRPAFEPLLVSKPHPPSFALTREEEQALMLFRERSVMWSQARREEICNHLEPLTGATGPKGVQEAVDINEWMEKSK